MWVGELHAEKITPRGTPGERRCTAGGSGLPCKVHCSVPNPFPPKFAFSRPDSPLPPELLQDRKTRALPSLCAGWHEWEQDLVAGEGREKMEGPGPGPGIKTN